MTKRAAAKRVTKQAAKPAAKKAAKKAPAAKKAIKKAAKAPIKKVALKKSAVPHRAASGNERVTPKQSRPSKTAAKSPKPAPIPITKRAAAFDFSTLPAASVEHSTRTLCLACIWSLFTKHLKLSPGGALAAIKKHEPTVAELTNEIAQRPYFEPNPKQLLCPYCEASARSHATLNVHRIIGSRATDIARKAAFAKLPKSGAALVLEEKSGRQSVVFHWLEALASRLDFSNEEWMLAAAQALLEKRDPKADWPAILAAAPRIRRSYRLETGWETNGNRLYLAQDLWDEVLLFQYLLSRSQHGGGRTFEGRLTLGELLSRLRRRNYFAGHDIESGDINDVLEALVESLDPGSATVRLYYVVDRRDFLDKLTRFGK